MTAAPKLGFLIQLQIENKRGFEDPTLVIDARVACWDDLTASFNTLDATGKGAVI